MTVFKPANEAELGEIIAAASRKSAPLRIRGGGTRPIGNRVEAADVVETSGINGISIYEPGALTIVASSGTTLEKINKTLSLEGQHLPFEPADYSGLFAIKGKSTIGGVVAAAVSGPRRIQAGACRDSLIGVRFVNGEGTILKNGGRVMKNVTGYDLVKLMAGSYGTLGVLTEVAFKVLPKPEMTGVVRISGLEDALAISVLAKAMSSPFDVSGTAHLQNGEDAKPLTVIRVEGFTESIKYRTGELKKLLAPLLPPSAELAIELGENKNAELWKQIRDVEPFHDRNGDVWRLSVKPVDGPKIVNALKAELDIEAIYDWGGGLVWLLLPEPRTNAATLIRSQVNRLGGHATLIRSSADASGVVEAFHPEQARLASISANLRRQFDPKGILNPGLMAGIPAKV